MPNLTEFEPYIRPFVSNCPSFVIQQQVLLAARQFFQSSRVWTEKLSQTLGTGKNQIYLPFGSSDELIDITLKIADKELVNAYSASAFPATIPAGTPIAFAIENGEIAKFSHAPAADLIVSIYAQIKPGLKATAIPDAIFGQWMEAIQYLATYHLLIQPKREWSNAGLGKEFEAKYKEHLSRAKVQARNGQSAGQSSIRMRPFA